MDANPRFRVESDVRERPIGRYGIGPALMGWTAFARYADDETSGRVIRFGCRTMEGAMKACEKDAGRGLNWAAENGDIVGRFMDAEVLHVAQEGQ